MDDVKYKGVCIRAMTESGLRTFTTKDLTVLNIEYPSKIVNGKKIFSMNDIDFLEIMFIYG